MTPERWKTIEDIFQDALDCAPEVRQKFIIEQCDGDENLRFEVEKLVARFETEETFLESPVWTDSGVIQPSLKQQIASSLEETISPIKKTENFIGRQIGVYRLVEEIGRGGMGMVYLAERADGEFKQKVAIKLIKRGMDTDFIVQRFRHERQILATLNHPNIARLLDGGTTKDDLPYFVMEFIEGEPFFKYSEVNKLNLRKKLELFLAVCAAIEYAHKRKIIHRDIKPGNILITDEGSPKLLDFGIAKILDPDLIHESISPTATQMRLMTPEYASPEQVRGENITPASDQYALGVLLYELITGMRPYKFPSRAPHEIARIICEEEPSEPSLGEFGKLIIEDKSLPNIKEISRRLDRIVLKSLRKNPVERYISVKEFSADIERFLRSEPVLAESFTGEFPEVEPITGQKSIAILPFKLLNRTASGATDGSEFLGIGLADALITRLSNIQQFMVRPTNSVLRYIDTVVDSFKAGEELNVGYVLDGTIINSGKRIRISVQLLNISTGSTVWADRFDEDFTDVLSLEDEISAKVAESLIPQLTDGDLQKLAKRGTDNAEAHEAYLRGRYHWNTFTETGFQEAIFYYRKATEIDPDYALAYAGIADYYIWLGVLGVLSPQKSYVPAKEAALRAIKIDDKLAEAHAALGFAQLCGDFDWQQAEKNVVYALTINPGYAIGHLWYSYILLTSGRFKEGIAQGKLAIELDPFSYNNYHTASWGYYFARQFDEALSKSIEKIKKFPDFGLAYFTRSWFLRYLGRTEESLKNAEKAMALSKNSLFVLIGYAQALAAAGKRAEAEEKLREIEKIGETHYVSYYHVALVYTYLGDKKKALDALERAWRDHEGWFIWIGVEPALDILRDEKRFIELLKKVNPFGSLPTDSLESSNSSLKNKEKLSREFWNRETIKAEGFDQRNFSNSLNSASNEKSIAVLPFKVVNETTNQSTDSGEFLAVGLADALVTRLSNIRQLLVRPTSSVLKFGDNTYDSIAAGRELNVGFVVGGTILYSEKQIRVSVQLNAVKTQSTVWAERFDVNFSDVLSLEDEIAEKIAESLMPRLTGDERRQLEKRGTDNIDAFEAYLRGRFHWNNFTDEGFQKSIYFYKKAIELDPEYALAYAGIADYYVMLGIYNVLPVSEFYLPAKEAALRAIEIDDKLSEAFTALSLTQLYGEYNWDASEKSILHAIDLNPNNPLAHLWYSHSLFSQKRFDEGTKHIERAIEIDPLSFQNHNTLAWSFYFKRQINEALTEIDKVISEFPTISHSYFSKACFLNFFGQTKEALKEMNRAIELSKDSLFAIYGFAQTLAADGQQREAEELIEKTKSQKGKAYFSFYQIALVYCYLKDKNKAFNFLEKSFQERESLLVWLAIEPSLDILRDDPRYFDFLKKLNHPLARSQANLNSSDQNKITLSSAKTVKVPPERSKKRLPAFLIYAAAAIILPAIAYGLFHVITHSKFSLSDNSPALNDSWQNTFTSTMNIRRLTSTGKEVMAAISPDGNQVAYVSAVNEQQTLRLRQTEGGELRQLVPSEAVIYLGLTFAPDGKNIYYTVIDSGYTFRALYRVSLETDEKPQKLVEQLTSAASFASDGKHFAYYAMNPQKQAALSLYVSEIDANGISGNPIEAVTLVHPEHFLGNPAFSPDGKKVVYAANVFVDEKHSTKFFLYDIESKSVEKLKTPDFFDVTDIVWRNNGNELVSSASENSGSPHQLWLINYLSGETKRLTNDLTDYSSISLDKNSTTLIAARSETRSDIWRTNLSGVNDAVTNIQLTEGISRQDGIKGLEWTKDNKIIYVADAESKSDIKMINVDGSDNKAINVGDVLPSNVLISPDNKFLFFISNKELETPIWRYEMGSGSLTRITGGTSYMPALTSDNRFIIYAAENDHHQLLLHRISTDGGETVKITSPLSLSPAVSSDNLSLAYYLRSNETNKQWEIVVSPMTGTNPPRIIKTPDTVRLLDPLKFKLYWSSDNRSIFYLNDKNGISNIFRVAVDGSKVPEQMTYFTSGRVFNFSVSPDNKQAVLARGSTSSDIVIFKQSK